MQSNLALQNNNISAYELRRLRGELIGSFPEGIGFTIINAFIKAWDMINDETNERFYVMVSGGSDSDLVVDMISRVDVQRKAMYFFADPGLEYVHTKEHIGFLERKYGIEIQRFRTERPVIPVVRARGIPFLSKRVSEMIYRLQLHNFAWEDSSYDELIKKYPNCSSALMWWTNYYGEGSRLNIDWNRGLREFLIMKKGPGFKISAKCCVESKERTLSNVTRHLGRGVMVTGVRKSEGGFRAISMHSCTNMRGTGEGDFRPIFWFTEEDKRTYCEAFGVEHSFCYNAPEVNLRRTGCCCCPCAMENSLKNEMEFAKRYEPMMYKAVWNVFGPSYELVAEYRKFQKNFK